MTKKEVEKKARKSVADKVKARLATKKGKETTEQEEEFKENQSVVERVKARVGKGKKGVKEEKKDERTIAVNVNYALLKNYAKQLGVKSEGLGREEFLDNVLDEIERLSEEPKWVEENMEIVKFHDKFSLPPDAHKPPSEQEIQKARDEFLETKKKVKKEGKKEKKGKGVKRAGGSTALGHAKGSRRAKLEELFFEGNDVKGFVKGLKEFDVPKEKVEGMIKGFARHLKKLGCKITEKKGIWKATK